MDVSALYSSASRSSSACSSCAVSSGASSGVMRSACCSSNSTVMVRCSTSPLFMRSVQTTSLWVQVGSARSRRYSSAGDSGVSSSASHSFTRLTPSGAVNPKLK